MNEYINEQYNL